ncbi:PSD1 and planctomycete cytochrome C domain-containing protein [Rhodopirellula sp. MGV]|uniref:PSD1 and planctomycete cytochrome C domain-containing protein n=1 Tax=Rhodopirellula sp. MGV TaxID=2023130 RepID=UPI001303FD4C|nr:PSD1 and planctomycete cytochrome C domain-containing protein [Rhodopirellula sp. MGV]
MSTDRSKVACAQSARSWLRSNSATVFGHTLLLSVSVLLVAGNTAVAAEQTAPASEKSAEQEAFFENKVRPLLVQHCVDCHGPDDQQGQLRLDRKTHFARGGDSGRLVVPGNVDASLLVRAIGYQDNGLQMPPDNKLSDDAIATIRKWVDDGAYWPEETASEDDDVEEMSFADQIVMQRDTHWSFQPIVSVEPPTITDPASGESLSPIDQFVFARLDEAGLEANPTADRETLIRRAYFNLLGLPPTFEEVQAFVNDADPLAFEKLVDRSLDNPHYGERWARHWLDIARYGDTKGYLAGSQETRYPFAFTYRDYVIDAFNNDKPFTEFIIEQIAADRLDLQGDDRKALAAMGYLTVGRKFMNRRPDVIDDQIDVVTRGFLGLSVSCARCHDHKYDPIPTADYYSLYGVFDSCEEPGELPLLGEPQPSPEYDEFLKAKAAKQKEVDDWLEERRVATEDELRSRIADYLVFYAEQIGKERKRGGSFQGKRGPLRRAAVFRWQRFLDQANESSAPVWTLFRELTKLPEDDFANQLSNKLDEFATANSVAESAPGVAKLIEALREAKPATIADAAQAIGDQFEGVHAKWKEAHPKESQPADTHPDTLTDEKDEALRLVIWQSETPTSLDRDQMIQHLDQTERNQYNQKMNGVNGVEVTHSGAPSRGMVLVDKDKPTEPVIFRRGVPGNRGDRVPRRFLQVLEQVDGGKPFIDGSGRLELAKAIANPDNPLTARVIVNRIWQHHFGEGLVRTSSDFGTRGEAPTHPQLLDYLAAEFMADGWSIKRLQRRIMLTKTWQQTSTLRDKAMTQDPENRLLWHMPRKRLEFEPLRDRLLVAAGRLDDRIGGRSVMIHQDATRRGLYAYIDREDLPGLLASFDVPSPDASRAQRTKTTVPQQALYLMNSGFVIEQAKALADRVIADEQRDQSDAEVLRDRIRQMYHFALNRNPKDWELQAAFEFVQPQTDNQQTQSEQALDRWEQLSQVLLLCNEFAFVD